MPQIIDFLRVNGPKRSQQFDNSPLNKGRWALQERMLASAPAILHYAHTTVMWECKTCLPFDAGEATMQEHYAIK